MRRREPSTAESHLAVLCGIAGVSLTLAAPEVALPTALVGAITGWYLCGRERPRPAAGPRLADAVRTIEVARDGQIDSVEALFARSRLFWPTAAEADTPPRAANGVAVLHRCAPGRVQVGVWILEPAIEVGGAPVDVCFMLAGPSGRSPEALLLQERIGRLVSSRGALTALRSARTATDATCALQRGRVA